MTLSAGTRLVQHLREDPGSLGPLTANGWFLTKHALGLYSASPPAKGFRWSSAQQRVDEGGSRPVAEGYEGPAELESYTVEHTHDGRPRRGIIATLTPDGWRVWAASTQHDLLEALESGELLGARGNVKDHRFTLRNG
jgi:acetyl-CoA C-acetyltransferase